MLCTELTAVQHLPHEIVAKPLHCRCWSCPQCAELRQRELVHLARAGAPSVFLTLTVNPHHGDGPDDRARRLVKAFRKMVARALSEAKRDPRKRPRPHGVSLDPERADARNGVFPRQVRVQGNTLPFLAVFERTKRGEPHLHIVARADWIGQEWLSRTMDDLIGAPVVDVRRADSAEKVARYIAKYLAKNPQPFEGTKRYWRSQDWALEPEEDHLRDDPEGATWQVWNERWDRYCARRARSGFIVDIRGEVARIRPPCGGPPG